MTALLLAGPQRSTGALDAAATLQRGWFRRHPPLNRCPPLPVHHQCRVLAETLLTGSMVLQALQAGRWQQLRAVALKADPSHGHLSS